jgi:hypothetical protein
MNRETICNQSEWKFVKKLIAAIGHSEPQSPPLFNFKLSIHSHLIDFLQGAQLSVFGISEGEQY